jgi:hypothetical protein
MAPNPDGLMILGEKMTIGPENLSHSEENFPTY